MDGFQELGNGKNRSDYLMGTGFSFRVMKMLQNQVEVVVAQHCQCTEYPVIIHFKMVSLVFCEFHLNKKILGKKCYGPQARSYPLPIFTQP